MSLTYLIDVAYLCEQLYIELSTDGLQARFYAPKAFAKRQLRKILAKEPVKIFEFQDLVLTAVSVDEFSEFANR